MFSWSRESLRPVAWCPFAFEEQQQRRVTPYELHHKSIIYTIMKIIGYRVDILTGEFLNPKIAESKEFFGENPLKLRRDAHSYAKKISETILEAIDEGVVKFKMENLLAKGVDTFSILIYCVHLDEDDDENEFIIYGTFIEEMLSFWEEETILYIECEYDIDGILYNLDCSKYDKNNITVIKDIYDMWNEEM